MQEVLEDVRSWIRSGRRVALATVVEVERKAPRDPGAAMAVADDGRIAGSISGGCVEPAVVEAARQVIATGEPKCLRFGISDDDAFAVGLACGGAVHVFVERVDW